MSRTLLLTLLLLFPGCGDDMPGCPDPGGRCVSARFSFAGGDSLYFMGPSVLSLSAAGKGEIKAQDISNPYAVSIQWVLAKVTGPGTHSPNVTGGPVEIYITRPHPTRPYPNNRTSNTRYGSLTFTSVSTTSGQETAGSFDALRLVRTAADDKIDLTITEGSFKAAVP